MVLTRQRRCLERRNLWHRLAFEEICEIHYFGDERSYRALNVALAKCAELVVKIRGALESEMIFRSRENKMWIQPCRWLPSHDEESDRRREDIWRNQTFETSLKRLGRWLRRVRKRRYRRRALYLAIHPSNREDRRRSRKKAKAWNPRIFALRHVVASIYPHGTVSTCHQDTFEAAEMVALLSIAAARSAERRILFAVSRSDQNACQQGCWCTSIIFTSIHVFGLKHSPSPRFEQIILAGGLQDDENDEDVVLERADSSVIQYLADALEISANSIGYVLRALVLAACPGPTGVKSWDLIEWAASGYPMPRSNRTNFAFNFFDASISSDVSIKDWDFLSDLVYGPLISPKPESPRALLFTLLPLIAYLLFPGNRKDDIDSQDEVDPCQNLATLEDTLGDWTTLLRTAANRVDPANSWNLLPTPNPDEFFYLPLELDLNDNHHVAPTATAEAPS